MVSSTPFIVTTNVNTTSRDGGEFAGNAEGRAIDRRVLLRHVYPARADLSVYVNVRGDL